MTSAPTVRGVSLRPMARSDEDLYCRLYSDPRVMAHIGAPLPPEAARKAFGLALSQDAATPPLVRYWIACEDSSTRGCGLLALRFDRNRSGSAEMGILLEPSVQGRGHASMALAVLAEHAFASFPLERLWTRHRDENRVVVRLMEALGFQREPGSAAGEVRWSMGREEWFDGRRRRVGFASSGAGS
ncbi:GNAT family N-acetyltransferase [Luteimonas vadosa]|uniref:N-acetyltransferase domain-containing protein n=1 Tax=Luteimonas vadosa TaxID=1165507 RepID=A0ABP9E2W1_9GAMM